MQLDMETVRLNEMRTFRAPIPRTARGCLVVTVMSCLLALFALPALAADTNTAQGYFDLYNNNTLVNVSNLVTGSGNGYGGLYSNLFDLFHFIDLLLIKKTLLTPKSLSIMETYGKPDYPNQYGYGIMKKFINRGIDAGYGHSGRDLGYSANLFYFPNKKVTHVFFVNLGTDANSNLKPVFNEFQEELLNITLQ